MPPLALLAAVHDRLAAPAAHQGRPVLEGCLQAAHNTAAAEEGAMGFPAALAAAAAVKGRPPDAGLGTRVLTWSGTSLLMSATLLEVKGLPGVSGKMGWM